MDREAHLNYYTSAYNRRGDNYHTAILNSVKYDKEEHAFLTKKYI